VRNRALWIALTLVGLLGASTSAAAGTAPRVRPAVTDVATMQTLAAEAYTWGLAPEFVHRFSHYQELVSAPVNELKYGNNESAWNNNGTNAGDASVLYINAFVDFNASLGEPMVLTVPPTQGQYYVAN